MVSPLAVREAPISISGEARGSFMAVPIVIPGPQMPRVGMPAFNTGNPPRMDQNQAAANAAGAFMAQRAPVAGGILGCPSCNGAEGGPMLKDVAPPSWWARIPLWAKIAGGTVIVGGLGFAVFKMTRKPDHDYE